MKRVNIVALMIIAVSLVNILAQYLAEGAIQKYAVNSDTLFWPTLLSDILAKGGSLSDWSLPPAPYFFPDLAIFLIAYLAGMGPHIQLLAFAVVQTTLVIVALWLLANRTATPNPLVCAAFIVATLSYLALTSNKPFDFSSSGPFVLMLVSVFHFGVFISSLFFLYLWLTVTDLNLDRKKYVANTSLMAILAFCSAISDSFFITQTIIPLIAMAFGQALIERRAIRQGIQTPLLIALLASAAGFFGDNLLTYTTTRPSPHIGITGSLQRLGHIVDLLISVVAVYPIFAIVIVSYIFIVVMPVHRFFSAPYSMSAFDWLSVFSLLSMLSTIVALLLLTNMPTIGARYLVPLYFWPVIVVALFAGHCFRRRFVSTTVAISVLMMTPLTVDSYELFQSRGMGVDYYPGEIACIDDALERTNARNGLAQYWDARYLQNFSKLKLNVAQYSVRLDQMNFFTSKHYFRQNYDFAISSGNVNNAWQIPVDALNRVGGKPALVKQCGSRTVYVYKKDGLHP